jgi:hypothetical protein
MRHISDHARGPGVGAALATDEDPMPARTSLTITSGSASTVSETTGSAPGIFGACETIWGGPLYRKTVPSLPNREIVPVSGASWSQPRSGSRNATGFEVIELPRSAWMAAGLGRSAGYRGSACRRTWAPAAARELDTRLRLGDPRPDSTSQRAHHDHREGGPPHATGLMPPRDGPARPPSDRASRPKV